MGRVSEDIGRSRPDNGGGGVSDGRRGELGAFTEGMPALRLGMAPMRLGMAPVRLGMAPVRWGMAPMVSGPRRSVSAFPLAEVSDQSFESLLVSNGLEIVILE